MPCPGPGRAWVAADKDEAPSRGGCGYRYRTVSDQVQARLSIRWAVSWTGSGGTSGELADMTTQVDDAFAVQQIQAVAH